MKIDALKLSGFKSFVEPAELKIRDGLTGVVGPNGCGKSNLLEAIRWVMGESSPKSMRSGGMEDVIFAGTESRPARNFAEVTLHAKIDQNHNPIPFLDGDDEIEVIRRIERGAGSAYRANSRDVRAKDIALIFADAATGANSPALVSQGRISNIISAKPAQRREMLEEAAGISGLHVRRKDAEQKLRAAERNLERLDTILSDMEARSGHLKRQARAAERYRKLTDQIAQAEARLIYVRWKHAKQEADFAKEQSQKADGIVQQAQQQHDGLSQEHNDAAKQLANDRAEAMASRDATAAKSEALITLKAQYDRITDQKRDLDKQAQIIDNDIQNEDSLTHDAGTALTRLKGELEDIKVQVENSDAQRPALFQQVEVIEKASRANEIALANAVAKQAQVEAELRVADAAVENSNRRLRQCEQRRISLIDESNALGDEKEVLDAKSHAEKAVQATQEHINKLAESIETYEQSRISLEEERSEKQSLFANIKSQYSAIESERNALEKSLNQDEQSANKAIGNIEAQSGFEKALAAALGEDAEAQIGGEIGRRWDTAITIETQHKAPIKDAICLADHVKAPRELITRLRHIWVVDQDSGEKLPIGHRLVTKDGIMRRWDGFIADQDGSLSAQYLVRRNRLKTIAETLPALGKQCDRAQDDIAICNDKILQIQHYITDARENRKRAEGEYRQQLRAADQSENILERLRNQKDQLQAQAEQAQAEHEIAKKEQEEAVNLRARLSGSEELQRVTDTLRIESENLHAQTLESQSALSMHDQSANTQRERKAVISAEIKGWQERAGEADKRIAAMQQRAKDIEELRHSLVNEPQRLEVKIAATQTEKQSAIENLTKNQAKEQASESTLKSLEQRLSHAAEELANAREIRASAEAKAENQEQRRIEMGRISGERFECPPPLLPEKMDFAEDTLSETSEESAALEKLQQDRERIGPVNLVAADELKTLEQEQSEGRAESEELIQAINQLRGSIGSLNREGRERLRAAFTAVDEHFRRLFTILFNGGAAHLELIDSDDPLEAGLEIMAQPPGKKLSSLTLLSGGEQALTAVALIFGLFLTNPAPICVLDEVDAPLDDANIERFCDLLDAMVKETDTRYLIVTHNAVTMSRMHRLYGVTMIEQGVSRLVSVDLGGAVKLLDNG